MIKAVTVTNYVNESIRLELSKPEISGLVITNITGLGPTRATVNMTELATYDGAKFTSSRLQPRNIVLYLRFLEHSTIEAARHLTYRYFPVKRSVKLKVETDERICEISGYVESNEPDIFSKEEGCQISVICPDPHFYLLGEYGGIQRTYFYGVDPRFEFPFSHNPPIPKKFITGEILTDTDAYLDYSGDSDIGVTITAQFLRTATGLSVYNMDTREIIQIDNSKLRELIMDGSDSGMYQKGDEVTISTVSGQKGAYLLRDGVKYNILGALVHPVGWFKIRQGMNHIAFTVEHGLEYTRLVIENKVVFEGV